MKCDNCEEKITDNVYFVPGYIYNCCSLICLARLMLSYGTSSVDDRELYLNGD